MMYRMRRSSAILWITILSAAVLWITGCKASLGSEAILRYRGLNGRAQRFTEHRHGTDAQRAVLRPLGARPR